MKLNPGKHITLHMVFFGKTGVTPHNTAASGAGSDHYGGGQVVLLLLYLDHGGL
jgi:hypothetical protein